MTDPAGTPADDLLALPASGEILADARGGGRWMRVTWHDEANMVVLSIWHGVSCVSTFRLRRDEVPLLVHALVGGLAAEVSRGPAPRPDAPSPPPPQRRGRGPSPGFAAPPTPGASRSAPRRRR